MPLRDAEILVVYITTPDGVAADIARHLVRAGLAACVNVVPRVRSIYQWKGTLHDEQESLLIVKTVRAQFDALKKAVLEIHPYEVPEIIGLPVTAQHAPYAEWVVAGCSGEGGDGS